MDGDTQTVEKEIQDINFRHNTLNTKHESLSKTVQGIAATGGASTATNVTYDNTNSGMVAENIQDAVDELAKEKADSSDVTKQLDKVTIKDEDGTVVDTPFRYIQNEEFIFAKVDANDKLLFGIQWDGTPKFGKTSEVEDELQKQITLLAERVAAIVGDEDITSTIDTLNELKTFFANIENTQSLTDILSNLDNVAKNLDKTVIKDEEGNIQDTPFRVIENEEFIMAVVDSENRVLFGIYKATGKPYCPLNDMYHISHSEEFLWVILDAANHPLLGIKEDGTCWAAKAQWLDDIKAIKEALSSIDETLKTFQPKEDGKGLINMEIADSFFYISNDEYIIAVVDAEDRILAGIKYDGQPYFPNHEMYSVITNEEWLYAIIDAEEKVLGGFRADDGHMIVGGIDISNFIANAIIDVADIKKRIAHISIIDNDEYLSIETDAEGKVIGYTAPDGSHYLYNVKSETIDDKVDKEEGKSLIDSDVAYSLGTIEDIEGRTEITEDADGKVLAYRDSTGKKHETSMETKHLEVSSINLKDSSVTDIQNALKANGFSAKIPIDWSESSFIQIPEPQFAIFNITGIDKMPTSKTDNLHAWMEFWDMHGNYFKKRVILNAQGNSSMGFVKKNIAVDICNDEWIGDVTPKVRIGNWVPQDSFHMKAYYTDFFRGICPITYKLYDQIVRTRGNMYDRPWKKALLDMTQFSPTTKSFNNPHVGDIDLLTDNGARCVPDGFPVACYLNDKFYGVFSWQLKKHRDNYHMDKSIAENIHLDGTLNEQTIFGGSKSINWGQFEIRNPKSLYNVSGGSYYEGAELADEELVNTWISNGTLPNGVSITSKIEKNLRTTAKVKKYILSFADCITIIKAAASTYEASSKTDEDLTIFKKVFEKFFDVDNLIDYCILGDVSQNGDGYSKNWQWLTYKGIKWWVGLYDCDSTFGGGPMGFDIAYPIDQHMGTSMNIPTGFIFKYYKQEIENRYKVLSDNNIISTKNILAIVKDWMSRIGTDYYKEEYKKWADSPCISNSVVREEYWQLLLEENGEPQTDESETFDATVSYSPDDVVSFGRSLNMGFYKFKCLKKTETQVVNHPHSISDYSPIMEFKHSDSIYRIEYWIDTRLKKLDKIYNYKRLNN